MYALLNLHLLQPRQSCPFNQQRLAAFQVLHLATATLSKFETLISNPAYIPPGVWSEISRCLQAAPQLRRAIDTLHCLESATTALPINKWLAQEHLERGLAAARMCQDVDQRIYGETPVLPVDAAQRICHAGPDDRIPAQHSPQPGGTSSSAASCSVFTRCISRSYAGRRIRYPRGDPGLVCRRSRVFLPLGENRTIDNERALRLRSISELSATLHRQR